MIQQLALLQQYPKLLGLGDMLKLKANQLTPAHIARVADAFEYSVPISDELVRALLDLLKGKDIHSVADAIQSPEAVGELVSFFKGGLAAIAASKGQSDLESSDLAPLFIS